MSALTETLRRAVGPRLVVASSRWRLNAAVHRALKRRPHIELFFAFDDPYSAIALPGLMQIAAQRGVDLRLRPLLERGIDGDPAADKRRAHAVADSRRLALRDGRRLARSTPLSPDDCAFLAHWTATAQDQAGINAFVAAALTRLWFTPGDEAPIPAAFHAAYAQHLGSAPPTSTPDAPNTLQQNRTRMLKLGHWESPAALITGEWFFAHERLEQIDAHLRNLSE